jgi:hypothetical protein
VGGSGKHHTFRIDGRHDQPEVIRPAETVGWQREPLSIASSFV